MKSLVATILASAVSAACEHDHEKYHSFSHSLAQFEFDWEPYTVTTEDGYLLTMFRLQGPIGNVPVYREAKQSVLVMPGIGMSADSWFNSPLYGEPMPIALYQAGYDVWLGNNRGTHHSLKHMEFDHVHDAEEYWNFSFAEMGERDLPAMMKTIKYTAQQDVDNPRILHSDKLLYIGYD
jgi:lysosomal acid lipase/cholesteryl ester hydrolase